MNTLCKIRGIYRSIYEFEQQLEVQYNLSINECMLLCSLMDEHLLSASQIASTIGLSSSNTSKTIKSVEQKGLIDRVVGQQDRRQMHFTLTSYGRKTIESVKSQPFELPPLLQKILDIV